ncbi:MAG: hypothetical protein R6T96_08560, partial [Longimicrobiales bacterium]
MRNLHTAIIHQIAHQLVHLARHYEVELIKFEDLRWSRHQKKDQVGYFLSTWQIHWFFSQV